MRKCMTLPHPCCQVFSDKMISIHCQVVQLMIRSFDTGLMQPSMLNWTCAVTPLSVPGAIYQHETLPHINHFHEMFYHFGILHAIIFVCLDRLQVLTQFFVCVLVTISIHFLHRGLNPYCTCSWTSDFKVFFHHHWRASHNQSMWQVT